MASRRKLSKRVPWTKSDDRSLPHGAQPRCRSLAQPGSLDEDAALLEQIDVQADESDVSRRQQTLVIYAAQCEKRYPTLLNTRWGLRTFARGGTQLLDLPNISPSRHSSGCPPQQSLTR
jgi:hypothetical protein